MRIVVSAGEASGRAMLDRFRFEMTRLDSGCEVVTLTVTAALEPVFGFAEGLKAGPRLHSVLDRAESSVMRSSPDAVVLISFSGFHLPLGRRLRRRGVPVLYVGPPQVWAWGGWRKRKLRRAADTVVCLFRFEENLLRRAGVNAIYFGYPLLDGVVSRLGRDQTLERLGLRPNDHYVVFLPGSRPAEIACHRPLFAAVLARLRRTVGDVQGVTVSLDQGVGPKDKGEMPKGVGGENGMITVSHDKYAVMRHADCACAVSGTVTAELAILGVPMVASYHLPRLSRMLAHVLVRTPHFALPNILDGTRLVPEVLEPEPQVLAQLLASLMRDSEERRRQAEGLARVAAKLGPPGAMARVCALAREQAVAGRPRQASND